MGASFDPVSPGQPLEIKSEEYNAMLRAAKALQRMGTPNANSKRSRMNNYNPAKIWVYNNTGSTLPVWGIVNIGTPTFIPSASGEMLDPLAGYTVSTPTANGRFAVCQDAIPNGTMGLAVIVGVTPCILNVTASGDTFADCTTSTTELTTSCAGRAEIIWKASGTGSGKNGVVLIGSNPSPKSISGWNASVQQVRGHNASGCEVWFDTDAC